MKLILKINIILFLVFLFPKELSLSSSNIFNDNDKIILNNSEENIIEFEKDYLIGNFEPHLHPDFQRIPSELTILQYPYLRKEVLEAFILLHQAAKNDGINLKIISATRNFITQKIIWEDKWKKNQHPSSDVKNKALQILRYNSMPGISRHHWGTDIDLNKTNNTYFSHGKGKLEYDWLVDNAHKFGFYQVYNSKNEDRLYGFEEEKWHWSYIPTAKNLLQQYIEKVTYEDITGFVGAKSAETIDVINKYVSSINKQYKDLITNH